jgi:hypothetical protein
MIAPSAAGWEIALNWEFPALSATGPRKITPGSAPTPTASPRRWVDPWKRTVSVGSAWAFVPIATSKEPAGNNFPVS